MQATIAELAGATPTMDYQAAEAAKQRDRELLERNRASVGLPPLTAQQLAEWGLEDTTWKGEDASVSARQA